MNNWLNGQDDDEPLLNQKSNVVIETIEYINKQTGGNFDNVGIGTDLDGFTHVPDDVNHCSKPDRLSKMIIQKLNKYGPECGNKVLFGNALWVFKECCCSPPLR